MAYLIWCVVWGFVGYFVANEVKKSKPGLNVNPILYGVGSFSIGILWCMIFLAYKYFSYKE